MPIGTLDLPELDEISRICGWLARLGWSEGAGGNLSVRLKETVPNVTALTGKQDHPLPVKAPQLGGGHLLVTGRGTRARDIADDPKAGVGLYRISPDGGSAAWLWGNNNPTSELPSHVAIHAALAEARPNHRAILHTHPTTLIALTHLPEFEEGDALSTALMGMQSEAWLHLPQGLAHLPYYLPGSLDLGLASAEAVRQGHRVVLWHMHGDLATGETASDALDILQVAEKAAGIYWTVTSAGRRPLGMQAEDVRRSLQHFGHWEQHARALGLDEETEEP